MGTQALFDPRAHSDHILDLGEASESGPAGGSSGPSAVEGDGCVASLGQVDGDSPEEALGPTEDGEGVDEDDDCVGLGIAGLEESDVELCSVACLYRR